MSFPPPPPPPASLGPEYATPVSLPIPSSQPTIPPSAPPPEAPRPPSLFTKQIEADEYLSEAAFKLYTHFFDELSDFVSQQVDVVTLRLSVQEKRAHVKRLREDVSRRDIEFIDHVRTRVATKQSLDDPQVMELFEAAQEARNEAGPAESEYEPLEMALGAEEDKLRHIYAKLETRFEQFFRLKADPSSQQSVPTNILYEESSTESKGSGIEVEHFIEPRDSAPFHGAWIGEQVAVGQVPIRAEEAMVETVQQRQREMRRPTVSSEELSKRHLSSVAAEEGVKDELPPDLAGISGADQIDMAELENPAFRSGVLWHGLAGLFADESLDAIDELAVLEDDLGESFLFEPSDTLLLSILPPEKNDTLQGYLQAFGATQEVLQEYLSYFENTRDRVNRWMLHQLRLSRREMFELQRNMMETAPDAGQWAALVLDNWSNDVLGQEQSYVQGSIECATVSSVKAAHHIITPHHGETAQEYKNLHGARPSSFMSNRAVASTIRDALSQIPSEGTDQQRPPG